MFFYFYPLHTKVMSTIQQIEKAISQLPPKDFLHLKGWMDEYEAEIWDTKFASDVRKGKLDKLARQAVEDFRKGKCKEL